MPKLALSFLQWIRKAELTEKQQRLMLDLATWKRQVPVVEILVEKAARSASFPFPAYADAALIASDVDLELKDKGGKMVLE